MKIQLKNEWLDYKYQAPMQLLGVGMRQIDRTFVRRMDKNYQPILETCYMQIITAAILGFGIEITFYTYPKVKAV